jgi:hypothetical protein
MKDAGGNVIGVEILHYRPALQNNRISVELLRTPAP